MLLSHTKFPFRYFYGSDGYKAHVYNYWHEVLASYFENVDDMDRRAEVTTLKVICYTDAACFSMLFNMKFE